MNYDELREALGCEYARGDWFLLDEQLLVDSEGAQFAQKQGKRPTVLLARFPDGVAHLLPRSTRGGNFRHKAHPREGIHEKCPINERGYIAAVLLLVSKDEVNEVTWSCKEPDDSPLWKYMRRFR